MIGQRKPGSLFSTLMLVLLFPVLAGAAAFRVQPESILLTDPEASQQLVISALTPAGENLDITRDVSYTASDPSIAASGDIAADGAFTLYTIVGSQRFVGAVEGEHRVTIIPAMGADQKFVSVRLKTNMIKVEAKENHFKIEIEKDPNS